MILYDFKNHTNSWQVDPQYSVKNVLIPRGGGQYGSMASNLVHGVNLR